MARILIITSRNVVTSGGEFSLIRNRANAFETYWGIQSDICALVNANLGVDEGSEAFGPGTYVRANFGNPASLLHGYSRVIKKAEDLLRSNTYAAVIVSGVGLLRYVKRLEKASGDALLCADVHGYFGDGKLLAREEPFLLGSFHRLASIEEEWEQKTFLREFDRIFTVSSAYVQFLIHEAGCRAEQFYVVPCGIDEKAMRLSDDVSAQYREAYRAKYGIGDTETLFVYSGGVSSWQCLAQTIELVKKVNLSRPSKLLILSGDREGAKRVVDANQGDSIVFVDSYSPSELAGVFCAADFFIMLREDVPTNHFAYPNKFLEYASAHKPTITTPYIFDIAGQVKRFSVGILFDGDVNKLIADMDSFDNESAKYDQLIAEASFRSRLVPAARDFMATN